MKIYEDTISHGLKRRVIELQHAKGYDDGTKFDCSKNLCTGSETLDCIVFFQSHFFATADKRKLIPMVYRDIANLLNKDISTIARAVGDRTYQLHGSTHYYKHLFKESALKDKNGREIPHAEIYDAMEIIIGNENKKKPLSDELIAASLADYGYDIARSTVCK